MSIDLLSTRDVLALINEEDQQSPRAVAEALDELSEVVDRAVIALREGHRVHYFGAGTSGRMGVLDAAEVPPTFGVDPQNFIAHIAGGAAAMTAAVEDAEDSELAGFSEAAATVAAGDVVLGLAASGRTPYVRGAFKAARERGAFAVAVTSDPEAHLAAVADRHLCLNTGPEALTGSTRMKAGTAQKILLHTFSTAVMVRSGHTYSNLMIDVVPTNEKLRRRVTQMLGIASGATAAEVDRALIAAGGEPRAALVLLMSGVSPRRARELTDGHPTVRAAAAAAGCSAAGAASPPLIGLDIGGSGYRIVARVGDGVARVRVDEPAAISGANWDAGRLADSIAEHLAANGIDPSFSYVAVGVAGGAHFSEHAQRLADRLRLILGASLVLCVPDATASYVGALGLSPGAVVAAGTGVVALSIHSANQWSRIDGLGHLLGDFGGGARIGQRGLEVAFAAEAGRPRRSRALERAAQRRFGSLAALLSRLQATESRAAVLASFVPDIAAAAASGDPYAESILQDAATEIIGTIESARQDDPLPVCVTGGLLGQGTYFRTVLDARCAEDGIELTAPENDATFGATAILESYLAGALPAAFAEQIIAVSAPHEPVPSRE